MSKNIYVSNILPKARGTSQKAKGA